MHAFHFLIVGNHTIALTATEAPSPKDRVIWFPSRSLYYVWYVTTAVSFPYVALISSMVTAHERLSGSN